MAGLTPMDIESVVFKKTPFKGYKADEVDLFLDKVIMEFENLFKENAKLQDKLKNSDDVVKHYKSLEDTIKSSIVRAEKTADETVRNASERSEQIISNAEERSRNIINEAHLEMEKMLNLANAELAEIKAEVAQQKAEYVKVRNMLKNMLITQMDILEKEQDCEVEE